MRSGDYGILSTIGAEGFAYGVPLSYVLLDNAIYFHCAPAGHKLDNISINNKVGFCVVGRAETLPAEFSVRYESVIVFGTASQADAGEKDRALLALVEKYSGEIMPKDREYIEKLQGRTTVVKIGIEHISGKARR